MLSENESITNISLKIPNKYIKKNKKAVVSFVDQDKTPSYYKIAKSNGANMDLIDIVSELPKQEKDIVLFIKNNIEYNATTEEYVPMVSIKYYKKSMSTTQKQSLSRALSSLIKKQIIGKIKTDYYMINPDLLIPQNYEKWKSIFLEPEKLIPKY